MKQLMHGIPMNLSFFGETNPGETQPVAVEAATGQASTDTPKADPAPAVDPPKGEPSKPEYDVKAEAQKIADAMVAKKLSGMPSKEELKAFKEWQDSQKTEAERQAAALMAANTRAEQAEKAMTQMKQAESIRKLNVDDAFVGFVQFEAANIAAKKDITFEEALNEFMLAHPDTYKKTDTRIVKVDTDAKDKPPTAPQMAFNFAGVRPRK